MIEESNIGVEQAVEPADSLKVESVNEEMIRELAAQADGVPYKPKAESSAIAKQSQEASEKPENKEGEKGSDEPVESSKETKEDSKAESSDSDKSLNASETSDKPETKDVKRVKEEARLAESWKKLEAEKAQVRAIQAELQRKAEEAEKASDPTSPAKPEELRKFAREWEEEGKDDLAKAARIQADKLEEKIRKDAERSERKIREFNETWSSSVNRMISENPELKDESSDLGKRVVSLLKSEDAELRNLINSTPNGFIYATQIAKMQKAAEESEALRTEIESLRKENGD
ncbi:MAG: hypothetical protein EBR82_39545 [Caulobacteraceae bacterium]|nr:hypothetical protein [Caulobacteraceae bacterium]